MDARWQHAGYSYASGNEIIATNVWGPFFTPSGINSGVSLTELPATNSLLGLYATVYHLAGAMSYDREVGIGVDSRPTNNVGDANTKPLVINSATPSGVRASR